MLYLPLEKVHMLDMAAACIQLTCSTGAKVLHFTDSAFSLIWLSGCLGLVFWFVVVVAVFSPSTLQSLGVEREEKQC